MKPDKTIVLKKMRKVPMLFTKTIIKDGKKYSVGNFYKPILKNT